MCCRPDGGGLIPNTPLVSGSGEPGKLLTMITCYPFYYVGSAPKRFIVEAEMVNAPASTREVTNQISETDSRPQSNSPKPRRMSQNTTTAKPRKGASRVAKVRTVAMFQAPTEAHRKHSFWHRIFHPV